MKKNYWLRLDFDFLLDEKVQNIHFEKGNDAIVAYEVAIIQLYKNGGEFGCDKYKQIAYIAHTTEDVVRYVIEDSGLFICEDGVFYSKRVIDELNAQKKISETRAESGKQGAEKRWKEGKKIANAKKEMANAIENDSKTIANYNYNNNKDDINNNDNDIDNKDNILPMEIEVVPLITPEEFKDMWNNGRGKCTKILTLTDERKEKAISRLSEFGSTREEQEKTILALMEKIRSSSLLQSKNWCNFDWLIRNSNNWVKVYEGNYEDSKSDRKDSSAGGIYNVNDEWQ